MNGGVGTPAAATLLAAPTSSLLGAALARMEIRSFFSELVPRLDSIELAGAPEYVASTFVGGLKHLPGHMVATTGMRISEATAPAAPDTRIEIRIQFY